MRKSILCALAGAATLLLWGSAALAQAPGQTAPGSPASGPPPAAAPAPTAARPLAAAPTRGGLLLGGALGAGGMRGDDCYEECGEGAGFAALHVGTSLSPKLAVFAELLLSAVEEDYFGERITLAQRTITVNAQYWVGNRLWLRGGVGNARLVVDHQFVGRADRRGTGAFALGAGYELVSRGRFALDLQLRLAVASYENDESMHATLFAVGVNWY